MRKRLIIILFLSTLFLLGGIYFLGTDLRIELFLAQRFKVREIATLPADLVTAQARWLDNPVKHYRLIIHYSRSIYPVVDCSQNIEVADEQILKIAQDNCNDNAYIQRFTPLAQTITALFAQFKKDTTTIIFREQGNLNCPYIIIADISYDSAGYPTSAKYSWAYVSPWNLGPQTYRTIYGEESATSMCLLSQVDLRKPDMSITVQPLPSSN